MGISPNISQILNYASLLLKNVVKKSGVSIVKVNATPKKILIAFNQTNRRVAFK